MRSAYTENRLKEIRKEKGIPELNDLQWFWSGLLLSNTLVTSTIPQTQTHTQTKTKT